MPDSHPEETLWQMAEDMLDEADRIFHPEDFDEPPAEEVARMAAFLGDYREKNREEEIAN